MNNGWVNRLCQSANWFYLLNQLLTFLYSLIFNWTKNAHIVFNTCRCRLSHSLRNICQVTGYLYVFTLLVRSQCIYCTSYQEPENLLLEVLDINTEEQTKHLKNSRNLTDFFKKNLDTIDIAN